MTAALIFVAALLFAGVLLRRTFRIFAWLYIPASVLAGAIGLAVVQWMLKSEQVNGSTGVALRESGNVFSANLASHFEAIAKELGSWPGWLIAVVFATLLLERRGEKVSRGARGVFSESLMVWVIVLGQTAVGLLLTWLVIQPRWAVPNSFGMLIETGFAGGHGTAAAMGEVFRSPVVGLEGGLGLGILMATAGLVYGVISGIFWINIGIRRGWARNRTESVPLEHAITCVPPDQQELSNSEASMLSSKVEKAGISSDLIEPILMQTIWITFAFAIGLFLQWFVALGAANLDSWTEPAVELSASSDRHSDSARFVTIVGSFPLFIYTLIGGWFVRRLLVYCGCSSWIDSTIVSRISTIAMDILVVAAMASLNLKAVYELFGPLLILLLGGCLWTSFCLAVLSKRILPRRHWFELGLINYGMSTGTTATGFVLLRIVDPDLDTDAPEDYALAAPFSAPFIGGGMLTTGLPILVLERFPIALTAVIASAIVVILVGLGSMTQDREP